MAVLKNFADRQHITFPLLSDPDSKIIRAFDILNETVPKDTPTYGIPYPGTYILDTQGRVAGKYFEDDFRERTSASDILFRQYGQSGDVGGGTVVAKHLRLTTAASTPTARPGHRSVLSLDFYLEPKMHVYSPGVQGYIPIEWKLDTGTMAKLHAFDYPSSKMMRLEAIRETVPVYQGHARLNREITFAAEDVLKPLVTASDELILKGSFRYQACDDRECYVPETVPLEWQFRFAGLDRERAPAALQRRPTQP